MMTADRVSVKSEGMFGAKVVRTIEKHSLNLNQRLATLIIEEVRADLGGGGVF